MELVMPGLGLIFWMTVTFSILLFILSQFAWKPILNMLRDREEFIENALHSAEHAREEMAQLKADNARQLSEARSERDRILAEARKAATEMVNKAREDASQERARLVDAAKNDIQNEKMAALTEVRNLAAKLSLDIAEKIIRKELAGNGEQEKLVNEYLKEAKLN